MFSIILSFYVGIGLAVILDALIRNGLPPRGRKAHPAIIVLMGFLFWPVIMTVVIYQRERDRERNRRR